MGSYFFVPPSSAPARSSSPSGVTRVPEDAAAPPEVFGDPARNPFATRRGSADIFATRGSSREDSAAVGSRDLFSTRRYPTSSRTHLAFSTSSTKPAPAQSDFSPPLGSVFATRRSDSAPGPERAPVSATVDVVAEVHEAVAAFDRGLELFSRKEYQLALDAWREAVALAPNNRTYQANLRRLERMLA